MIELADDSTTNDTLPRCDRCGGIPTVSGYFDAFEGQRRHLCMVRCLTLTGTDADTVSVCGRQIPVPMPNRADAVRAWGHLVSRKEVGV